MFFRFKQLFNETCSASVILSGAPVILTLTLSEAKGKGKDLNLMVVFSRREFTRILGKLGIRCCVVLPAKARLAIPHQSAVLIHWGTFAQIFYRRLKGHAKYQRVFGEDRI